MAVEYKKKGRDGRRMKKIRYLIYSFLVFILAGCSPLSHIAVLNPKGLQAKEQLSLISLSIVIMLFVFLVVLILFILFVYKYRERPGYNPYRVQKNRNKKLELTWTISPFILLFILAVPMVKTTFGEQQQSTSPSDLKIKVTASQYWWQFEYEGQGVQTAQELHLPKGKKVLLELHAKDVIHSFWVPQLGGKQDLIPGRTNTLVLTPTENGTYEGKCAELCGPGHALMRFKVKVESEKDFKHWLQGMKAGQKTVALSQTEAMGKQLFDKNCLSCHAVDARNQVSKEGPNLAGLEEHDKIAGFLANNKDNLKQWIKDPSKLKPGTEMPKVQGLSEQDYDELVQYLQTLH